MGINIYELLNELIIDESEQLNSINEPINDEINRNSLIDSNYINRIFS